MMRTALRVVHEDEAAFRETMACFAAFMKLGFRTNDLQVGMLPSSKNVGHAVSPVVIVRQGENALTYRLDNHELAGSSDAVERRWREWVGEIMGNHADVPEGAFHTMFASSRFAKQGALELLQGSLRRAGIALPGWGDK
jgi:hypothetical protein